MLVRVYKVLVNNLVNVVVHLIHVPGTFLVLPIVRQKTLNTVVDTFVVLELQVKTFILLNAIVENFLTQVSRVDEIVVRANECSFDTLQR